MTHLHGTDMKMIDRIDRLEALAELHGTDLAGMADRAEAGDLPPLDAFPEEERGLVSETRWEQFRHGRHWADRLRAAARASDGFIVISPHDRDEAKRLLGAEAEWIPNGVDTGLFDREELGTTTSGSCAGASGWWRTRGAGTSPASPAASATPRRTSRRSRTPTRRCCCSSGASWTSSACRCSCAPTPPRASGSTAGRRW